MSYSIQEDPTRGTGSSRRAVLATGMAGLALTAAGCTAYGKEEPPGEGVDVELGPASEVPEGGSKIYPEAKVIVSQPAVGRYLAFSAVCTHQGCTVNRLEETEAVCPCHGSRFKAADGTVATGPATEPLAPAAVRLVGDKLYLTG
jgi:Rieske Fe-S protein